MCKLTILTPTFNRRYIIDNLYQSLLRQTNQDFQWFVVDDGSTDNTKEYFDNVISKHTASFPICYYRKENGGKQRAINFAIPKVEGEYVFIVDSDDALIPDAVEKVKKWIREIDSDKSFAAVSGIKGKHNGGPIGGIPNFMGNFVDATNLERPKYNLSCDMAEIYRKSILEKYPFYVWPGEKFVPEATVWDDIAMDGYKIRWHKDVIYLCEYLEDGLTKGSWDLLKKNPMGYAMLFNQQLKYTQGISKRFSITLQMTANVILAKEWKYFLKSNSKIITFLVLPLGFLLSIRRRRQFQEK